MTRNAAYSGAVGRYTPPARIIIVTAPSKLIEAGAKVMRDAINQEQRSSDNSQKSNQTSR
jgi:hypothetical protein